MDPAVLDSAVERGPVNDDGRSGATLERLVLPDGTRLVVKRYDPATDLLMRLTGDARGLEVAVLGSGVLDRLPASVAHPILDAWYDERGLGVVVMRDLGSTVLGWGDVIDGVRARQVFASIAALHAAFAGSPPDGLMPLEASLGVFEPQRLRACGDEGLVTLALRGWDHWPEVVPGPVGARVLELAQDSSPLVRAAERFPATLLHGDLSTVNMAFEPDRPGTLTLIDWGLAGAGPAEVDVGRLLAGCGHLFDCSLDDLLALHRASAGPAYDERALQLGLLSGLVWLGWNKALDIVEHPDAAVRERERANLPWWLAQAEACFEAGVV